MAESENVYVKIGERGRYIERIATSPRDHVNLRGTGWVPKNSEGAPTEKDATAKPMTKTERAKLTDATPTSVRAYAEAAEADAVGDKKAGARSGRGTSTAAGSAGEAADAASQTAAGR